MGYELNQFSKDMILAFRPRPDTPRPEILALKPKVRPWD